MEWLLDLMLGKINVLLPINYWPITNIPIVLSWLLLERLFSLNVDHFDSFLFFLQFFSVELLSQSLLFDFSQSDKLLFSLKNFIIQNFFGFLKDWVNKRLNLRLLLWVIEVNVLRRLSKSLSSLGFLHCSSHLSSSSLFGTGFYQNKN